MLVEHFLKQSGHTGPREAVFDDATLASMAAYAWPGNVRELRNLVSSAVVLGSDWTNVHGFVPTTTTPSKSHVRDHGHAPNSPLLPYNQARAALVDEFEYDYLTRLNEQCGGNVSKAARVADMDRGHLTALLRKHGIK